MNRICYIGSRELFITTKKILNKNIVIKKILSLEELKNEKLDLLIFSIKKYKELSNLSLEYREYLGLTNIPILYVLDNNSNKKIKLLSSLDDYIIKPFFPKNLKIRINARLEVKYLSDKLRYAITEQMSLLDLSEIFSSNFSYKKSLSILSKKLSKIFKTDLLSILIIEDDIFKVVADARIDYESFKEINLDPEKYPEVQEALDTKKIIYIDNVKKYKKLEHFEKYISKKGIKSILILPIIYQDEVLGAISVKFLKSKYKFYKNIINYSMIITNTTALALKNAKSLESVQLENENLIKYKELAKFSHLYTEALKKAGIPTLIIENNGTIVYFNNHIEKIVSNIYHKLHNMNFFNLIPLEKRERLKEKIKNLKANEHYYHVGNLKLSENKSIWIGMTIRYFKQNNSIIEFDFIEKYKKEQKFLENEIKIYKNIIDMSDSAYVACDNFGNIKIFNQKAQKILGYSEEEAKQLNIIELYPSTEKSHEVNRLVYINGRIKKFKTLYLSKFKNKIKIELDALLIYNEKKEKIGMAAIFKTY